MNIEELKEAYGDWIVSIYRIGSSVIPWINHPHDIDYLIFVTDNHDSRMGELFEKRPEGECWFVSCPNKTRHPRNWSYICNFKELLYGEPVASEEYNIFEHEREYKMHITQYALGKSYSPQYKFWYHVLTAIYLFDNGGYFLTEEQKANVVLCKNKQMTIELHDFIQTRLKEWQEELCQ